MNFKAFKCGCGYQCITPTDAPKCEDCGKDMVCMDTKSDEYKKLDSYVKKRLGL